jgi:hypothetical protein
VEITLFNPGTDPLWLVTTGCGGLPVLEILDASQQDHFYGGSECSPTFCHEFMGAGECQVGCNNCAPPSARVLLPGGRVTINWPGSRVETKTLTAECAPGMNCQEECLVGHAAAPGSFSVQVAGFTTCSGACACDVPNQTDSCTLFEVVELGQPVEFSAQFEYPAVTAVEVVLGGP